MFTPCLSNVMNLFQWIMLECKNAHIELQKILKTKNLMHLKWHNTGRVYDLNNLQRKNQAEPSFFLT